MCNLHSQTEDRQELQTVTVLKPNTCQQSNHDSAHRLWSWDMSHLRMVLQGLFWISYFYAGSSSSHPPHTLLGICALYFPAFPYIPFFFFLNFSHGTECRNISRLNKNSYFDSLHYLHVFISLWTAELSKRVITTSCLHVSVLFVLLEHNNKVWGVYKNRKMYPSLFWKSGSPASRCPQVCLLPRWQRRQEVKMED